MVKQPIASYARYLPTEIDALRWGIYVIDCGYTEIPAGSNYPPVLNQHPAEYSFSGKRGRILSEFQLVYISRGRGIFESEPTGRVRIESGHVFMIFPGIRHRYRPVRTVGWDENWIGFNGEVAARIMGSFFSPEKAVIRVGPYQELKDLIRSISGLMDQVPAGYQQIMGARTMEALALVRSRSMTYLPIDRRVARKVQQTRQYLEEHYRESIDMKKLARELGLSYSRFRSMFKEHTGVAPHQYQLGIRLNLARYWLVDSDLSVTEIAHKLGFSSVYYFSRVFKNRMGSSPSAYRSRKGTPS